MGVGHPRTRIIGAVTPTLDCWRTENLGIKHELWNISFFPSLLLRLIECENSWPKPVGQDGVDVGLDQYVRRHPACKEVELLSVTWEYSKSGESVNLKGILSKVNPKRVESKCVYDKQEQRVARPQTALERERMIRYIRSFRNNQKEGKDELCLLILCIVYCIYTYVCVYCGDWNRKEKGNVASHY
jgi:hypothetical protein